jgi:hypothetical protein
MLMPVLTSVAAHLEKGDFQGSHLSTIVWSLAKLETKPVKLLQRIEEQVVSAPAAPRLADYCKTGAVSFGYQDKNQVTAGTT